MVTYEVTNQGQCENELFSPAGEWLTTDDLTLVDNVYYYTLSDLYSYSNYRFTVTPGIVDSITGYIVEGRAEKIDETTGLYGKYVEIVLRNTENYLKYMCDPSHWACFHRKTV